MTSKCGIKHKNPQEEEKSDVDKQEVKRLKFDEEEKTSSEEKKSSCHEGAESLLEPSESTDISCGQECKSEPSCDTPSLSDHYGKCEFIVSVLHIDICFLWFQSLDEFVSL